jgi:DNA-binding transcriptional ArsR family regulator
MTTTPRKKKSTKPNAIALDDPKAMRALAHPLRLKLLSELRITGPRSVGELCGVVDAAPGSVSYHLGVLAENGFVEPAPELARDARETWWRARHAWTTVEPTGPDAPPEERLASRALRHGILQAYVAEASAALEREETLPTEWIEAATSGDAVAHLTASQLAACGEELRAVAEKWAEIGARPGDDTAPAILIYQAFRKA